MATIGHRRPPHVPRLRIDRGIDGGVGNPAGRFLTAMLEIRIDSLHNENRRLKDQVDAVVTENRKLTARNAELETKRTESPPAVARTPKPAPVVNTVATTRRYDNALCSSGIGTTGCDSQL